MLELLLFAILVMLVLIYLQLKKNIKETDSYFAAIDLSLRQFFANISNTEDERNKQRNDEVLRRLDEISKNSSTTVRILERVHPPPSIDEQFAEEQVNWLPNNRL